MCDAGLGRLVIWEHEAVTLQSSNLHFPRTTSADPLQLQIVFSVEQQLTMFVAVKCIND